MTTVLAPAPVYADPASFAYAPKFPSIELLDQLRDWLPSMPAWDGAEGPRARLSFAAGAVGVSRRDLARRERTLNRASDHERVDADLLANELLQRGQFPVDPPSRQEITKWSRKSRANMVRALCELDYAPLLRRGHPPAMITLTYSGQWEVVAPNGAASKRHLWMFRRAYVRAWGEKLRAIWKLEFQRRGAPHYHLMMVPPRGRAMTGYGAGLPFKAWLSRIWARIVAHPDPEEYEKHLRAGTGLDFAEGLRARDPKRVAVYFLKHGAYRAKEYQNIVPALWQAPGQGPGRFWGYWGLQRLVWAVELAPQIATAAARLIRRWSRAQGVTQLVDAPRTPGGRLRPATWDVIGLSGAQELDAQAPTRTRRVRRRVIRLRRGAGWVSVNSGLAFMSQLARYLTSAFP